jgi:hypothetical protein
MDGLYQVIGGMLKDDVGFVCAYALVIQSGTDSAVTIKFVKNLLAD